MATAKKAARKPATKKPASRKPAAPPIGNPQTNPVHNQHSELATAPEVKGPPNEYDPQWHAKLEAYTVLKDAGAPVPEEIRIPVERWLADQEAKKRVQAQKRAEVEAERTKADEAGPKWLRNCSGAQFVLRLERQDKKRRIELQPRGQRGDIFPLEDGDEKDHNLIMSLSGGLVEIIGQTEADEIVTKQTTNIQRIHNPLAILRNERGEAGNENEGMRLVVEEEHGKQGKVVGYIEQNERKEVNPKDAFGGIRREQFIPNPGGNPAIVSSGFEASADNHHAKVADDIARRAKGADVGRPEEALGLAVTVEPAQKT